jgi:hypothetical protein
MTSPYEPGPGHSQPSTPPTGPTPQDPQEREPMRDPPITPDHDDAGVEEIRQAGRKSGIEARDPAPDAVVYDQA